MIFKPVLPFPAFVNGENYTVTKVNVQSIEDNLVDKVTFKYTLSDESGAWAGAGRFTLGPENYKEWDATDRGAYEIVCKNIGLTLSKEARFAADYKE